MRSRGRRPRHPELQRKNPATDETATVPPTKQANFIARRDIMLDLESMISVRGLIRVRREDVADLAAAATTAYDLA